MSEPLTFSMKARVVDVDVFEAGQRFELEIEAGGNGFLSFGQPIWFQNTSYVHFAVGDAATVTVSKES